MCPPLPGSSRALAVTTATYPPVLTIPTSVTSSNPPQHRIPNSCLGRVTYKTSNTRICNNKRGPGNKPRPLLRVTPHASSTATGICTYVDTDLGGEVIILVTGFLSYHLTRIFFFSFYSHDTSDRNSDQKTCITKTASILCPNMTPQPCCGIKLAWRRGTQGNCTG